jgi:hypothetical protein
MSPTAAVVYNQRFLRACSQCYGCQPELQSYLTGAVGAARATQYLPRCSSAMVQVFDHCSVHLAAPINSRWVTLQPNTDAKPSPFATPQSTLVVELSLAQDLLFSADPLGIHPVLLPASTSITSQCKWAVQRTTA